ncbi:S1C family serine protease [Phenylobacterium deserti]|nr:trypsin-like peptidase domain-containing protein [Phenylobacterium deserti]
MKWVHLGAGLGALSLACAPASYAMAQSPEAELGGRVDLPSGKPSTASARQLGVAVPRSTGLAYGRALRQLEPETRAATRGAAEAAVYRKAAPAVVLVVSDDGFGSGVLVSSDGKIVTNLHVVGKESEVGVIFKPAMEGAAVSDGDARKAKVIRRDEVSDLALLQVDEVPAGVTPLAIGNSTTLEVGADVHAIGHPTGRTWTYTRGIVSQIRRAYGWKAEDKIAHEATVIQTQTPINPGNSGGPLLDDNLNVVGINSFIGEGEGLNFAVSAEDVKTFLARTSDRVTVSQASAEKCEVKALEEEQVTDPKGTRYLMDADCDNEADSIVVIPDSKRHPSTLWFDDDGDGKLDTMFFDNKQDGTWDEALYDTDGNDKPDMIGYFRKGEDEPYKWEKIKEE